MSAVELLGFVSYTNPDRFSSDEVLYWLFMCCWFATSLNISLRKKFFEFNTSHVIVCFRFFTPGFSKGKEFVGWRRKQKRAGRAFRYARAGRSPKS